MPDYNSSDYRHQLRSAVDHWAVSLRFSWFVTLNINAPATFQSGRRLLKRFSARLDKKLLGPRFHEKDVHQRTLFIAVPEHVHSNFHYHLLMKINAAGERSAQEIEALIGHAWSGVIRSGTVWVREIYDEGAARYTAKDLLKPEHFKEFIVSTEFVHTR